MVHYEPHWTDEKTEAQTDKVRLKVRLLSLIKVLNGVINKPGTLLDPGSITVGIKKSLTLRVYTLNT